MIRETQTETRFDFEQMWRKVTQRPLICWSRGVHQDVMRQARLRGPHPFYRHRHRRMAGK